ncbi:MAG: hypothetical protein KGJ86_17975 [Chloroflexota bacterium]|nr:hypothetical protein [Chloroflexota bacterium]
MRMSMWLLFGARVSLTPPVAEVAPDAGADGAAVGLAGAAGELAAGRLAMLGAELAGAPAAWSEPPQEASKVSIPGKLAPASMRGVERFMNGTPGAGVDVW